MRHELTWFKDGGHRAEYERLLSKARLPGPYGRSFLYVLAATGYGKQAEPYIDFEQETVNPNLLDGLVAPSGGEERMIRTALHRWNTANPRDEPWTVMDLRGLDSDNLRVCLLAIEHLVSNIG